MEWWNHEEEAMEIFEEEKEITTGAIYHKPVSEKLFVEFESLYRDKFPEAWIFTTQDSTP